MDDSYVEDALDRAEERFQNTRGQTNEPGLDTADVALIQLRKACRLLEAARTLRERNGIYRNRSSNAPDSSSVASSAKTV